MNIKHPDIWNKTYRSYSCGERFGRDQIRIVTALHGDELTVVSDVQIIISTGGGSAARAEIRLDANAMRDMGSQLLLAADRINELERMRERLIAEEAEPVE